MRIVGGVEARAEGRVVAGEGAAGDELFVDGGGLLVLLAPEERPGPPLLGSHEAGHHDRQNDGAAEVDEEYEERVSLDRQVHDERQSEDEDAGREERQESRQELPVRPHAQEIPVLPADGEEEAGEYRQGA